jgi:HAD superfamily hydrolase (TIGR01457 family)
VAAADAAATSLITPGQRPLTDEYDVALVDLDGTVYTGREAITGAVDALDSARKAGLRLAFVTNNASRSPAAIAAELSSLGVPASAADVVTSAQAAASLIAGRVPPGSPVLVCGGMGLRLALRACGLRPVSTATERPVAVVQGYAADLSYGTLAEAALAVRAGALFVAANTDPTLPTQRGPQPGNGSLVQVITTATGVQPVVAGKPERPLHAEAIRRTGARRPLVVGDRLDTDISGAVRGGADSLLVLTGVTRPVDAVLAPPGQRPTYLAADLGALTERSPAIGPRPGGQGVAAATADRPDGPDGDRDQESPAFRCGGWTARRAGAGPLELTGSGEPIDGLRALCAAAWWAWPADAGSAGSGSVGGDSPGSSSPGEVSAAMAEPALRMLGFGA